MRIAAILSVSEDLQSAGSLSGGRRPTFPLTESASYIRLDVLGQNLLDRAIAKLRGFGVSRYNVIPESSQHLLPPWADNNGVFGDAWERAVSSYVQEGIDLLLFLRVKTYSDLDYVQFLRFHLETQSPITQAYAADGALDIALVDASRLRTIDEGYGRALSTMRPRQGRFLYSGYINRLARPQDFYRLVNDGLRGQCGLNPIGTQTREGVWQGEDSRVDDSAKITGPAFVGGGSSIGADCTVTAGSSIERQCDVDCGTLVEESWITPNTYLGVALDVRRSIVGQTTLFHLERNVEVEIADHRLIGSTAKSGPMFAGLGSLLWGGSDAAN